MVHTLLDRPRHSIAPRPTCPTPGVSTADLARRQRYSVACAVLDGARRVIARGWLQHGWYLTNRPRPRSLLARLRQVERTPAIDEVRRACLVAAVAVSANRGGRSDPVTDAGPALDLIWDALWETRGYAGGSAADRIPAPDVRAARMRELVRWNDSAGRTQDDVLALLDRAISRGIIGAVGASVDQRPAVGALSR
jgi:hypothetical protein